MCGRFTLIKTTELSDRFDVSGQSKHIQPNYNAAPSQSLPVVYSHHNQNTLLPMKWGLVPSWSKEPKTRFSTINARAEGLEDSRLYKKPFKSQRCIIPADGFYEWQQSADGKAPQYIHLHDNKVFGLAGLYEVWRPDSEQEMYTFTIITTAANSFMEPIHNRMPVILERQYEEPWLDPSINDVNLLYSFLKPYDETQMKSYPVSTRVNNVRNNQTDLIEPISNHS